MVISCRKSVVRLWYRFAHGLGSEAGYDCGESEELHHGLQSIVLKLCTEFELMTSILDLTVSAGRKKDMHEE